jgi:hypothetical protein
MPTPTKEQFEQTILDINGSTCDQFKKMVTLSKLISEVYSGIYNNDGDLDPDGDFLKAVCANLDCDGNGPVGSTTSTTAAPVTTEESDLFLFRTELDSPSVKSVMLQMNGNQFDSNETINEADITDIPGNRLIIAAAIQPSGTGDLYVVHTSGVSNASGSDLNAVLATCDKATGALTDIANLTLNGVVQQTDPPLENLGMDFKRDDGTLYLNDRVGNLYTVNPADGVMTEIGDIGTPPTVDIAKTCHLSFDHDGTLFSVGAPPSRPGNHLLRTIELTIDPDYGGDVAITSVCGGGTSSVLGASGSYSKGHPLIIRRNNLYILNTLDTGGRFYSLGKTPEDSLGGSTVCEPATQIGAFNSSFANINAVAYQAT